MIGIIDFKRPTRRRQRRESRNKANETKKNKKKQEDKRQGRLSFSVFLYLFLSCFLSFNLFILSWSHVEECGRLGWAPTTDCFSFSRLHLHKRRMGRRRRRKRRIRRRRWRRQTGRFSSPSHVCVAVDVKSSEQS